MYKCECLWNPNCTFLCHVFLLSAWHRARRQQCKRSAHERNATLFSSLKLKRLFALADSSAVRVWLATRLPVTS